MSRPCSACYNSAAFTMLPTSSSCSYDRSKLPKSVDFHHTMTRIRFLFQVNRRPTGKIMFSEFAFRRNGTSIDGTASEGRRVAQHAACTCAANGSTEGHRDGMQFKPTTPILLTRRGVYGPPAMPLGACILCLLSQSSRKPSTETLEANNIR